MKGVADVATTRKKSTAALNVLETSPPAAFDGDDLAAQLPESLTVSVDLPAQVHSAPAQEAALAISDVVVDPGVVGTLQASTTSIDVIYSGPIPIEEPATYAPGLPEPAEALTAERLIGGSPRRTMAPEGRWPAFIYAISLHLVNLGDSRAVRERKELDARSTVLTTQRSRRGIRL